MRADGPQQPSHSGLKEPITGTARYARAARGHATARAAEQRDELATFHA
jgi:hypothetical protein